MSEKKYYWEYPENENKEVRRKYHVGDIKENATKCHLCGDYIRSNHVHDFKYCSCGNVAVDGGSWYAKRCFKGPPNSFTDTIVAYDDVEIEQ